MKRNLGVTLIEMLICISILLLVAAISYPAFLSAKMSAKISSSKSLLYQHFLAISLYQSDLGGSDFGMPSDMGLPCFDAQGSLDYAVRSLPPSAKHSPCGTPRSDGIPTIWWLIYRPFDEKNWLASLQKAGGNIRLVYDIDCDFPGISSSDEYVKHRAFAVSLNGTILSKVNVGNPTSATFWGESPEKK